MCTYSCCPHSPPLRRGMMTSDLLLLGLNKVQMWFTGWHGCNCTFHIPVVSQLWWLYYDFAKAVIWSFGTCKFLDPQVINLDQALSHATKVTRSFSLASSSSRVGSGDIKTTSLSACHGHQLLYKRGLPCSLHLIQYYRREVSYSHVFCITLKLYSIVAQGYVRILFPDPTYPGGVHINNMLASGTDDIHIIILLWFMYMCVHDTFEVELC